VEGDKGKGNWVVGADADGWSKGGWWKESMECGVDTDTVGESETLCALNGGFSASSLRIIASVDTRRTGAGATRTVGACPSSWCTLDVVRGRSRWFLWSASRIGSNVGIGNGQSWNKSSIAFYSRRRRGYSVVAVSHSEHTSTDDDGRRSVPVLQSKGERPRARREPDSVPRLNRSVSLQPSPLSTLPEFIFNLTTIPLPRFPRTRTRTHTHTRTPTQTSFPLALSHTYPTCYAEPEDSSDSRVMQWPPWYSPCFPFSQFHFIDATQVLDTY